MALDNLDSIQIKNDNWLYDVFDVKMNTGSYTTCERYVFDKEDNLSDEMVIKYKDACASLPNISIMDRLENGIRSKAIHTTLTIPTGISVLDSNDFLCNLVDIINDNNITTIVSGIGMYCILLAIPFSSGPYNTERGDNKSIITLSNGREVTLYQNWYSLNDDILMFSYAERDTKPVLRFSEDSFIGFNNDDCIEARYCYNMPVFDKDNVFLVS